MEEKTIADRYEIELDHIQNEKDMVNRFHEIAKENNLVEEDVSHPLRRSCGGSDYRLTFADNSTLFIHFPTWAESGTYVDTEEW